MFLFAKYANKIAAGEEVTVDEKDDPAAKQCPKCGLRYPDLNRRICPHCMEKGKLFRRFSIFLMRYRASIIITMISLAVMTALSILAPYLSSGFFYDEVIYGVGEFAGQILLVLGLIIATRLLKTLVTMVNNYVTSRIAAKMVFDLKKTIFSAIERLSLSFFTGRQTGGLMTQINEDANTIYSFFCDGVPYMLINIVQVSVLLVLLFLMQPMLALVSLLTVPAFLFFIKWMYRRQRLYHARRFAGSKQMNSLLLFCTLYHINRHQILLDCYILLLLLNDFFRCSRCINQMQSGVIIGDCKQICRGNIPSAAGLIIHF